MAVLASNPQDPSAPSSLTLTAAKSWLGHSEPAAGAVGIAHMCLAFAQQAALPIMHLRSINPHVQPMLGPLSALHSSVYMPRQPAGMQHSGGHSSAAPGLVAGVSAFAFQGTNAHVIMQAASGSHQQAGPPAASTIRPLHCRQRHWIAAPAHAMLLHAGASHGLISFQADVASPGCAYLLDHVVSDQPLLPATAFFELACASVRLASGDSSAAVMGVTLAVPMKLQPKSDPGSGLVTVQLQHGSLTASSYSHDRLRHHLFASWGLLRSQPKQRSIRLSALEQMMAHTHTASDTAQPQCTAVASVAEPTSSDGVTLHPAAADSMLHLASAFNLGQQTPQLRVPAALDAIQGSSSQSAQHHWVCATQAHLGKADSHTHSFRLASDKGWDHAALHGLCFMPLEGTALASGIAQQDGSVAPKIRQDCLYEVMWVADELDSSNANSADVAVCHQTALDGTVAVIQQLQQAAAGSKQVSPVMLPGQVLTAAGRSSSAHTSSIAITSLMRVAAQELANPHCHAIMGHPSGLVGPASTRTAAHPPGDVALQAGVQHSPRLVPSAASSAPRPFQLMPKPRGALQNLRPEAIGTALAADEVLLQVHAVGVNFRDVLNVLGMYPGDPGAPGADCAGIVMARGTAVRGLDLGEFAYSASQSQSFYLPHKVLHWKHVSVNSTSLNC